MNLAEVRDALETLAAALTGLDVVWEDQARPFVDEQSRALCLLSLVPAGAVGRDELRTTFDINDDFAEFHETAVGRRRLTWRIRVDSYEQGNADVATGYVERARTRLRWSTSVDALNAVACTRETTGSVLDLSVPEDERVVSRAVLEVVLGAVFTETNPVGYTYIASISGTGTIGTTETDYEVTGL